MPLRSMTGFGQGESNLRDAHGGLERQIAAEIRSLNGRFLELKLRQPFGPEIERLIRKRVDQRLGRGRVELTLRVDVVADDVATGPLARFGVSTPELDAVAQSLAAVEQSLRAAGLEARHVSPLDVLRFLSTTNSSDNVSAVPTDAVLQAVDRALDQLVEMRTAEGGALTTEVGGLIDALEERVGVLAERVSDELPRRKAALIERISALCQTSEASVDAGRVAQEVALLVARADVTEELARLASHFEQIRGVLSAAPTSGQGKTLDFLAQELVREVTTLGSKVADHRAAAISIEAKGLVERFREQVQNVE